MYLPHNKILLYNILICLLHIDLYIYFRWRNNIYGRIIADHQLTLARTKSRFCYTCSNQIKQYREQLDIISWQKNQCNRQTHTHIHMSTIISITRTILCHKNSNYLPPKIARIVLVYVHAVYLPLSVQKRGSFVLDSLVWRVFNSNDARKSFFKYKVSYLCWCCYRTFLFYDCWYKSFHLNANKKRSHGSIRI